MKKNIDLSLYTNTGFSPGRNMLIRFIWMLISRVMLETWIPWPYAMKRLLLRFFGAYIGKGVIIKPRVRIKYPWRLKVGNHCWLGEAIWIDNVTSIIIGANVCISQGAYMGTGSHEHTKTTFDLVLKDIVIDDGVWIGARAIILPGSVIKSHAVIAAGAVFSGIAKSSIVYVGNPAQSTITRTIGD